MAKIRQLVTDLHEARAKYHAEAGSLTSDQIAERNAEFKKLNQAVVDVITDGANDCPDCGGKPHGIFHDGTPKPFEIGCLNCRFLKTDGGETIRVPDGVAAGIITAGDENTPAIVGAIIDGELVKGTHLFNHRVRETLPEDAVERWNAGNYDAPREPGTVVMTHRDNTGKVISEKTAKLQTGSRKK